MPSIQPATPVEIDVPPPPAPLPIKIDPSRYQPTFYDDGNGPRVGWILRDPDGNAVLLPDGTTPDFALSDYVTDTKGLVPMIQALYAETLQKVGAK